MSTCAASFASALLPHCAGPETVGVLLTRAKDNLVAAVPLPCSPKNPATFANGAFGMVATLAGSPDTPAGILPELGKDRRKTVVRALATNPSLPGAVADALHARACHEGDHETRELLLATADPALALNARASILGCFLEGPLNVTQSGFYAVGVYGGEGLRCGVKGGAALVSNLARRDTAAIMECFALDIVSVKETIVCAAARGQLNVDVATLLRALPADNRNSPNCPLTLTVSAAAVNTLPTSPVPLTLEVATLVVQRCEAFAEHIHPYDGYNDLATAQPGLSDDVADLLLGSSLGFLRLVVLETAAAGNYTLSDDQVGKLVESTTEHHKDVVHKAMESTSLRHRLTADHLSAWADHLGTDSDLVGLVLRERAGTLPWETVLELLRQGTREITVEWLTSPQTGRTVTVDQIADLASEPRWALSGQRLYLKEPPATPTLPFLDLVGNIQGAPPALFDYQASATARRAMNHRTYQGGNESAAYLGRTLTAAFGDNAPAWATFTDMALGFTGTVGELVVAVAAVCAPALV